MDQNRRPDRDQRNNEPRINRRIRVPQVRVIGADGSQLGILSTYDAFRLAESAGLDLVEVQPMSRPPVCKIMDYGKFKYEQKKKAAESRRNQKPVEVKEVKFRPGTDDHDFDTKVRKLREFLQEGHRAKITVTFRGREMTHRELGVDICNRVEQAVADLAFVERRPVMEGRSLFMMITPGKAKPTKTEAA